MLLQITHSIYAIFSLIIQKNFIEIFFTVTSRTLIKYHPSPNLPSRRITKNVQTHLPPERDVIIESTNIVLTCCLNQYCLLTRRSAGFSDSSPTDTSPKTEFRLALPRRTLFQQQRLFLPNISLLRHFRNWPFPRPYVLTIVFTTL